MFMLLLPLLLPITAYYYQYSVSCKTYTWQGAAAFN